MNAPKNAPKIFAQLSRASQGKGRRGTGGMGGEQELHAACAEIQHLRVLHRWDRIRPPAGADPRAWATACFLCSIHEQGGCAQLNAVNGALGQNPAYRRAVFGAGTFAALKRRAVEDGLIQSYRDSQRRVHVRLAERYMRMLSSGYRSMMDTEGYDANEVATIHNSLYVVSRTCSDEGESRLLSLSRACSDEGEPRLPSMPASPADEPPRAMSSLDDVVQKIQGGSLFETQPV